MMAAGKFKNFDIIIVGAGPAGTASAIECGRRGLKTLLLDTAPAPRPIPGETLHPGIAPLLRKLDLHREVDNAGFRRHPGFWMRCPTEVNLKRYGRDRRGAWLGYQADRRELKKLMILRAESAGAVVALGEKAAEPILIRGRVCGVRTSVGKYWARFVMDGSGAAHWLASRLGLPMDRVSPRLIARYGWVETDALIDDDMLPEFHIVAGGWRWMAPVASRRLAWSELALNGARFNPGRIAPWISPAARLARDVSWRVVQASAGPGYFLAGDAAWILDPASSHGVLKAVYSGIAAANAMTHSLLHPRDEVAAARSYCGWMKGWFSRDAMQLLSLYSSFPFAPGWIPAASELVRQISINPSA